MKKEPRLSGFRWTDETKAQAAKLWNDGVSAGQIAVAMNVSRNTVIGMVNRNRALFRRKSSDVVKPAPINGETPKLVVDKIALRPAPARPKPEEKPTYVKPSALGASLGLHMRSTSPPKANFAHAGTAGIAGPVPFMDLTSKQCHWPLNDFNDRSGADMPCCGQAIVPGRSYCQNHLNLAYKVISRD